MHQGLQPYKPSGESDPAGLALMFAASLGAGVAAGVVLLHVVGSVFSLFIIFPCIVGGVAGGAASLMVEKKRIRAPFLAAGLAFVAGLGGWCADQALNYVSARGEILAQLADVPDESGGDVVNAVFAIWGEGNEATPEAVAATLGSGNPPSFVDGVVGFLSAAAKQGVSVNQHGHDTKFGETGTLVIFLVELFLCGGAVAAAMAFSRARQPFCEQCGVWYGASAATIVGRGPDKTAAKDELLRDDMDALARRAFATEGADDFVVLDVRRCPKCEIAPLFVKLAHNHAAKKKSALLAAGLMPSESLRRFVRAIERERERAAPAPSAPAGA